MKFGRLLAHARWILIAVLALFVLAIFGLSQFLTDYFWYDALGYTSLMITPILWTWGTGLSAAVIAALFLWLNVFLAKESISQALFRYQEHLPEGLVWRHIRRLIYLGTSVIGVLFGLSYAQSWRQIALGIHGVTFGHEDAIFGQDVGFYVFTLPMLDLLQTYVFGLLVLATAISAGLYLASKAFEIEGFKVRLNTRPRIHLSLLLVGIVATKAFDYYLAAFDLLFSTRGAVFGAAYTDVHASLPALRIMMVLSALVALALLVNLFRPAIRFAMIGIAVLLVASVVVGSVYPNLIQEYIVRPNELERELPYVANHIEATRKAYGLDHVRSIEYDPTEGELSAQLIERYPGTFNNVRLWDWRPLLSTYKQLQELRPYYDFIEVDIDRYMIDGEYRQVMLAVRELTSSSLQNRSWVNVHLQYTHGIGVVMSPVNEVSPQGLPNFFIQNIPPVTEYPEIALERPQIYYGEQASDYVVVNTLRPEFDYPMGDENATTIYEGTGGVPMGNWFRRALFAARMGTTRLLLASDITAESRIMFNRQVVDRVRTLVPFLRLDPDPYPVIADGQMYWVFDAFTQSNRYPYSAPVAGWGNYVRNPLKIVVDAYNGSVDFYVIENEPIIQAWQGIYPDIFKPIDEMPESLKSHLRYPEDLFRVQASVLARYHMTNPQVFYNQEDVWALPREIYHQTETAMAPYYNIMQLEEGEPEEFVLMIPYTPFNRGNMIAWLAARNDGEHYGELLLYRFSKQETVFGPMQFEARVSQDTEISRELTLWSQQGSQVIRGNLIILPVGNTLLYVEPLFLQAEQGQIPELKRVIVGDGTNIVMRETFHQALEALVGERIELGFRQLGTSPEDVEGLVGDLELPPELLGEASVERPSTSTDRTLSGDSLELIQQIADLFDRARESAGDGDWAAFGAALDEIDALMKEVQQ